MSKSNETFNGDLFSPIITAVGECIQIGIAGGIKVMPELVKKINTGEGFKVSQKSFKVNIEMLDCKTQTESLDDLGWSVSAKRPYPLSYFEPALNTCIVGASGWGKTNLINLLQENCMKRNQGLVFIDPKGSLEAMTTFKKLCKFYDRKCYIFSHYSDDANSFNPIADMDNTQRLTTIMRSFDWGKSPNIYYYNESQKALMSVLKDLSKSENEFDLHDVYKELKAKHDNEATSGLLTQLFIILESSFGKLFRKSYSKKKTVTLKRAWDEKCCVYIGCSTQGYSTIAKTIGKMFVSEAMNLSDWIGATHVDSKVVTEKGFGLFIDEAGSVVFPDIIDLANKCRSSGINLYLAMQSYSDAEMIAGDEVLMKQFFDVFSNWFIQKQTHGDNASKFAAACGTVLSEKKTMATENGMDAGRGSTREANEYLCHPDIFKSINRGQAILLEHGPKSIHLLNLRDCKKSKAFEDEPEKSKEEVRNSPLVDPKKIKRRFR